jgi:hypothetical protein
LLLLLLLQYSEDETTLASAFRKAVGSPIGSDFFFVVKKKKLFAHRVLLCIGSDFYHQLLTSTYNKPEREREKEKEKDVVECDVFCRGAWSSIFGNFSRQRTSRFKFIH